MSLRWSKRTLSLARPSGGDLYARGSRPKSSPCYDGCFENNFRAATSTTPWKRGYRLVYIGKREHETNDAASSSPTTTDSVEATITPSTLPKESSASPSATATAAPSGRPNIASIAGAAAGGLVFLLLAGIIVFFWIHTQKSRRHHKRTFERRSSELGDAGEMGQKQLVRVSVVAEASPHSAHPRHQRTASHIYISPTTTTERRASQHASRDVNADPSTYRHYSAEDFRLPQPPATVWKTSHRPTTWDLTRRSIGMFELDSPLTPEEYSAATSRKSSEVSSLGSGSRKSSLKSGVSSMRETVPVPPVYPPPAATGASWDTHRRSASTGIV
ncbi:hypothetical protein PMIN06_000599 [Paraphaeosphaeria minitans]